MIAQGLLNDAPSPTHPDWPDPDGRHGEKHPALPAPHRSPKGKRIARHGTPSLRQGPAPPGTPCLEFWFVQSRMQREACLGKMATATT